MARITKAMQAKHRDSQSPWLRNFVQRASTVELPLLPKHLSSFPSRWPFGRGDLYHWISLLNRFDSVLEHICHTYHLHQGHQLRDFALDVLLNQSEGSPFSSETRWAKGDLESLGFALDGDRVLVEAVLRFTRMLLEHCGNRSIYASSSHINDLLHTSSPTVLICALEVGSELAQRYQASLKRVQTASRQISSALLANHYNIDLERVQQIALPFVKTPIINLTDSSSLTNTVSTKGKERGHGSAGRSSTPTYANDLVAVATCDDTSWQTWGDVKVFYHPNDEPAALDVADEPSRPSAPSTPTPLRRSQTAGSQQNTPRLRNSTNDETSPTSSRTPIVTESQNTSGQKCFELPLSTVAAMSIYDLMNRCPADMPTAARYEVFHRLRVAKSLTGSRESRQRMLAARLLAITNLAYIHNESNFVEKTLRHDIDETRRYQLVYQLAELIHPSADGNAAIPLWLQTFALALLEAISGFAIKNRDVLTALNANVNHGILLYVIRKAVASMRLDDSADTSEQAMEEDDWRNNLFSLTLHLSMSSRIGSEMVTAGLMDILVEILYIRSHVAQRHHSMVLAFLDGLIWSYQNAFTSFFNASGLDCVARLLVDTAVEAQQSLQSSDRVKTDHQSAAVDYEIPYYQQQTLKWLLKFVHHIMTNSYSYGGNTERLLRNLAEKSDLLQSLRDIIADQQSFGSVVWTHAVTILSDFINNDPTSFPAILESGMITTYLETITGKPVPDFHDGEPKPSSQPHEEGDDVQSPHSSAVASVVEEDDWPHPLNDDEIRGTRSESPAQGILASSEAMNIVPQVLSAICLNNVGMKMVIASKAFRSFLEIFESLAHVRVLDIDHDLAINIGSSFDELARHHPPLRKSISNAVINMFARVRWLGIEMGTQSNWGVRLYVTDAEETPFTVRPDKHLMKAPTVDMSVLDKYKIQREDANNPKSEDVDMPIADNEAGTKQTKRPPVQTPQNLTAHIHALTSFMTGYLSNSLLKELFVEGGGIEILLDLCESPSLDVSFGDSVASRSIAPMVVQLIEQAPACGLPSLLRRAQNNIDILTPLASKTEILPPYFGPLLGPNLHSWRDDPEMSDTVLQSTKVIKALLNAQTLIRMISDCFSSHRSHSAQFYAVNVYDYYLQLVTSIGPLLRGVLAEEAAELAVVPTHWSSRRDSYSIMTAAEMNREAARGGDVTSPDVMDGTGSWAHIDDTDSSPLRYPTRDETYSLRYMNYDTLRSLLHPMIPTCFPLFQSLGRALLHRREPGYPDAFPRPRQLEIALALADMVLSQLKPSVERPEPTAKDAHYWIIMLHTIHEMLVDHTSSRHSERSGIPHIVLPVLLAFKERGGLEVLNNMLRIFATSVKDNTSPTSTGNSMTKVADFGLRKVLDLYHVLSNGKNLSESFNHFNIQRPSERLSNATIVQQQIVVEIRAAILSAVAELWTSSFFEKVPNVTVNRLLDVLKVICVADHEPQGASKDRNVTFDLFKFSDVKFKWSSFRNVFVDTVARGFDEELVQEAIYRANGGTAVFEYCRAHTARLAGCRNPVPSRDADASALREDHPLREDPPSREEEPLHATDPESDPMILDVLSNIPSVADVIEHINQSASNAPARNDSAAPSSPQTETAGSSFNDQYEGATSNTAADRTDVKDELDKQRAVIRKDLIDQCLDILGVHPATAIDVSDFISAIILRKPNFRAHEEIACTLTLALSSLATDDAKRRNPRRITAYAHLLALLLQDEKFFDNSATQLADKVDEYVDFLRIPTSSSTDDLPPYIPYILLLLEVLLCHDERPIPVSWKVPRSIDDPIVEPIVQRRTQLIESDNREKILEYLLELLPRIGKQELLATAVLRVLVILTRKRNLAKLLGEKKNLQRLFLMAKQLSGSGSERLKQTRLTANLITVLRHVVEDEEIVKQIMRAEISADFPNLHRTQRGQPDVTTYLRAMAPVALRSPDLFVEVTNELLQFSRWTAPTGESEKSQILVLKNQKETDGTDEVNPTDSEPDASRSVKPSTETEDKEMTDAPKTHQETKRPIVENQDGVIHFLLSELVAYREVDDKEPPSLIAHGTDVIPDASASEDGVAKDSSPSDGKDKKQAKSVFRAEDHPIFVYKCFLLNCLTELLQSYTRTKVDFINFKRNAPPVSTTTPVKPRSSILNHLIYDLLCQGSLTGATDTTLSKKRAATSMLTQRALVALVSKTSEKSLDRASDKFDYDDEPDLLFVRKFVLDTVLKAYEKAPFSDEPLEARYSRMQCLAELMINMVGDKDRDQSTNTRANDNLQSRSQAQMRRLMYEKGYVEKLTSSIAEISLGHPAVKRTIKYILRVLRILTFTAKELSLSSILPSDPTAGDNSDGEFASSSSLSDVDEDDREETPDLYRNSALGMLEPRGNVESDEDEEDGDEDMYEDEYDDDDDEMDYGGDQMSDGEDEISDEDEELSGMGDIEGLHGEPGVVEVIMDEDDDEDDSDDGEDDDMDSANMEVVDDRVEIIDEDDHPLGEDDESGWESDSDAEAEDDPDEDGLDYEAEAQDANEANVHGMAPTTLLDNMARAIMGDDGRFENGMSIEDNYLVEAPPDDADEDDDEEEADDEEYIYDEEYPSMQPVHDVAFTLPIHIHHLGWIILDQWLIPEIAVQIGTMPEGAWDGVSADMDHRQQLMFLESANRRRLLGRLDNRSPFPTRFAGNDHRNHMADFRSYFSRSHRSVGPQQVSDGLNPLLRRGDQANDATSRPSQAHWDLRIPSGLLGSGRHAMDGPMSLLGELMEFLPLVHRGDGQTSLHFHVAGSGGPRETRDLGTTRWARGDQRREVVCLEPHQAVSFLPDSTMNRYQEEARLIFGMNHLTESLKLGTIINARLTPAAIELEKKIRSREEQSAKKAQLDQMQKEKEDRQARELVAAEERAAKEKKETEEREERERIARERLVADSEGANEQEVADRGSMEGVEDGEDAAPKDDDQTLERDPASDHQARVMTTIRGEEVDVTELGIDPEYLAALPEEFREEVIAQTVSERRSQAREEAAGGESTEVFQEFLDALPEELRLEIAQQERQEERRRHREESRRQAATSSEQLPVEMDAASILLTFPPALREQVLMDQGEDIMDQLTPEMAAQARALNQQHPAASPFQGLRRTVVSHPAPAQEASAVDRGGENKTQRRTVVQMLDKSGVATLMRLMFIIQVGSIRGYLFTVFADVCENRQTRLEVISTILQILQEGSVDMNAVERSFGQLSIKARRQKERESEQKTPQSLKKTWTAVTATNSLVQQTNSEISPLLIVQQCLDLLVDLCTKSNHIPWLFLTEHEVVGSTLKRALSRKGKAKDSRAHKYAINSLLLLLDREVVTESSIVMTLLADLLNRVTLPLLNLERKRKDANVGDGAKPVAGPAEGEQSNGPAPTDALTGPAETAEPAEPSAHSIADVAVHEEKATSGSRRLRHLQPPFIPPQNLTLVVKIFVARECSSKTFQNTISTIKNLSAIPGAKTIFGQELVSQARILSENIVSDLDELLPHIERATSGTEVQGVALSKFSPGASEQNKLLRVLTALDHLFDGRKKDGDDTAAQVRETDKQLLVTSLYHNSTFSAMWDKLSACLKAMHERDNMLNIATILLPLIESLMVVCKNSNSGDDLSQSQAAKDMVISSPPPEARTASLFFTFTEDHRRILNELVRNNPKLMSGTFALLVKNPKVLEFDNKRNYFNRSVHSRNSHNARPAFPHLQLSVRRDHVFHDSFRSLYFKSGDEMKFGKLNIRFHGEEGIDAGGVTREWFQVLARQMFDPNYVLFIPVSSDRTTFHPNKLSAVNPEHLLFFKFIGRVIGKALYEGRLLDCFFSRAVYKRILGKTVSVKDMESFDPDYFKSLCWMLENDITDIITETFSIEDDEFGVTNILDLVPNGRDITVSEENKHEYVRLVVEHKLLSSVKDQMESFLKGFHEIVPAELISIFNEQELELLISGLPDIDVDDWKSNTEYQNYTPSSPQIQWFWRAVRSFDKEERAKLLQFVTGTSKVPLNGFKELEGMNGISRFNVHRDYGDKDRLPSSHTCFNQLDLPEYESYDKLRAQVLKAITQGSEYFGFA